MLRQAEWHRSYRYLLFCHCRVLESKSCLWLHLRSELNAGIYNLLWRYIAFKIFSPFFAFNKNKPCFAKNWITHSRLTDCLPIFALFWAVAFFSWYLERTSSLRRLHRMVRKYLPRWVTGEQKGRVKAGSIKLQKCYRQKKKISIELLYPRSAV